MVWQFSFSILCLFIVLPLLVQATPSLTFVPLPGCGAQVMDDGFGSFTQMLRAEGDISSTTAAALRNALSKYGLLIAPNMTGLSTDAHLKFTHIFGEAKAHPQRGKPPGLPCLEGTDCLVEVASTDKTSTHFSAETRADHWHADITFNATPPAFTTLHSKHILGGGRGDTIWACTALSYEGLSPSLQQTLKTLWAVHTDRSSLSKMAEHPVTVGISLDDDAPDTRVKHALYVNHQFTAKFRGWTEEESRPLLQFLLQRATDLSVLYRHRWAEGDLVVWDNRQTLHYGVYDHNSVDVGDVTDASRSAPIRVFHRTTAGYHALASDLGAEAACNCGTAGIDKQCTL